MAQNININTGKKTAGEFVVTFQTNGNGACTPVIDGVPAPSLTFGYTTESDKQACLRLIKEALVATNGNVFEATHYLYNAMMVTAADIKADESVMVDETEVIIDYAKGKAYVGTEEVANIDDMTTPLTREVAKALLVERTRLFLATEEDDDDDDDDNVGWNTDNIF